MFALAVHGGAGARQHGADANGSAADLRADRGPDRSDRITALRAGLARALEAGASVLRADASALDAVQAAVVALEDDPLFNAGRGAVLACDGGVELDAAIMDGAHLAAGAVALVRRTKNPVRLARCVLDRLPHVFMAGDAADRFAGECGLPMVDNSQFVTEERRAQWLLWGEQSAARAAPTRSMGVAPLGTVGTVGAVARDRRGHLAAATSTGGTLGKRPGRIGDSPVIGAGTYADDASCAVSTTGHGEWFMRTVQAYDIAARLRYGGATLSQAVEQAVFGRLTQLGARGGLIAVDAHGLIVMRHNAETMLCASMVEGGEAQAHVS